MHTPQILELTPEGRLATSDDVSSAKRLAAQFELAIKHIPAFFSLYETFKGSKMPAREVLADNVASLNIPPVFAEECVDTFIVNAKSIGLLRTIGGAERLISIEQALEQIPDQSALESPSALPAAAIQGQSLTSVTIHAPNEFLNESEGDFAKTCFYVTPIGDADSESRHHADFMMEFVVKPALKEFDLLVVRADQMGQPGMIGRQVVEHILKSRLVIADLSFHNPNVFYELCLRHTTRLPTVQIKRAADRLPFDLNQSRTISIDTADVYRLYPMLQTHIAEIATQVRRALQDVESADNPISLYYPSQTWMGMMRLLPQRRFRRFVTRHRVVNPHEQPPTARPALIQAALSSWSDLEFLGSMLCLRLPMPCSTASCPQKSVQG